MVLSNKKLKQKLREALRKPELSNPNPKTDLNSVPQPQNDLNHILDSVSQKPKLSRRQKRRQSQPPTTADVANEGGISEKQKSESGDVVKIKKKRNRIIEDGGEQSVEKETQAKKKLKKTATAKKSDNEVEKEDESVKKEVQAKKKKKKKKNKKKTKKNINEVEKKVIGQEPVAAEPDMNDDAGESQVQEEVATKVYVGGIPYYSTEEDIQSFFEGCGTITEIDCMSFPDSGKFRGIAIIDFKTEGAAKRALALNGSEMGELSLKIQPYKTASHPKKSADFAPKLVEGYNRIYAGNLSWDITEDDLRKLFSDCSISSIRWGSDKETGDFRGYAHVDFADSLSQINALQLNQHVVCGRPVKISCAVALKGGKINSKVETSPLKSMSITEAAGTGCLNSVPAATSNDVEKSWVTSKDAENSEVASKNTDNVVVISKDVDDSVASAGKMRRRTCYECGGKGHISSACPKKQTVTPSIANTSNDVEKSWVASKDAENCGVTSKDADNVVVISTDVDDSGVSAGKMRRRTCYECGGKGHISSACPKKQTVSPSIANTS